MAKLEYSNGFSLEIEYDGAGMMLADQMMLNTIAYLTDLHKAVTLASFSLTETPADSGLFAYEFETAGGREWHQVLQIQGGEPSMTFDVPDFWKLSEFALARPLREAVIEMVKKYGVTKMEATWD